MKFNTENQGNLENSFNTNTTSSTDDTIVAQNDSHLNQDNSKIESYLNNDNDDFDPEALLYSDDSDEPDEVVEVVEKKQTSQKLEPWHKWSGVNKVVAELDEYPKHWRLTPVRNKEPFLNDWQNTDISREEIKEWLLTGKKVLSKNNKEYLSRASGAGLKTGNGVLVFDCDGISDDCEATRFLNPLIEPYKNSTPIWTSGKSGRYVIPFDVPEGVREIFKGFTRSVIKYSDNSAIEIRYEKCQCVLPPGYHPDTGKYQWIHKSDTVAELEGELLDLAIRHASSEKTKNRSSKREPQEEIPKAIKESLRNDNTLLTWFHERVKKLPLEQIFSRSQHQWKSEGNRLMGMPIHFDEFPEERSASAFYDSTTGLPVYHDFTSTDKKGNTLDALQYHWQVIRGNSGNPKGINWRDNIVDFAISHGWIKNDKELPQSEAYRKYEKAIEDVQKDLNNLKVNAKYSIIQSGKYLQSGAIVEAVQEVLKSNRKPVIISIAPTGAGKTTVANKILELFSRATSITPTRSLAIDQSTKLNLNYREDVVTEGANEFYNNGLLEDIDRLVLCHPSLHRISTREPGALLLDECDTGLRFLFESPLCNKASNNRPVRSDNVASFKSLVRKSECLIVPDAFLSQPAFDYLMSCLEGQDIEIILVDLERKPSDREIYMTDEEIFRNIIDLKIDKGEKVVYASDSKNDVKGFNRKIEKSNLPYMSVHGDNVNDEECQDLLKKPTDYLLNIVDDIGAFSYSPSLGAGFSFDEKVSNKFDVIFQNNVHLSAMDVVQQSKRFRGDKPLCICVGKDNKLDGCNSFLPSEHKEYILNYLEQGIATQLTKQLTKNIENSTGYVSHDYVSIARDTVIDNIENSPETKYIAECRARDSYNLVNRKARNLDLYHKEGYKVIYLVKDESKIQEYLDMGFDDVQLVNNELLGKESKENHQKNKEEVIQEESEQIIKSEEISKEEYDQLKNKINQKPEERKKLDKYWFNNVKIPGIIEAIAERTPDLEGENKEELVFNNQVELLRLIKEDRTGFVEGVENFVKYQNFLTEQTYWDGNNLAKICESWIQHGVGNVRDAKKASTSVKMHFVKNVLGIDALLVEGFEIGSKQLSLIADEWIKKDKNSLLKHFFGAKRSRKLVDALFNKVLGFLGHRLVEVSEGRKKTERIYQVQKTELSEDFKWLWDYISTTKLEKLKGGIEDEQQEISQVSPISSEPIPEMSFPLEINVNDETISIENDQRLTILLHTCRAMLDNKADDIKDIDLLKKSALLLVAYEENIDLMKAIDSFDCTFSECVPLDF